MSATAALTGDGQMRVLLDNGIHSHSEFAEDSVKEVPIRWGDTDQVVPVQGLIRKAPHKDVEYQGQMDALFTVGRLIREGTIEAYEYWEIECERMRDKIGFRVCNALKGCNIRSCRPAVERSRFRQTVNFEDAISKGGKKDRKAGVSLGQANQIAFFEWLCTLTKEWVDALLRDAALIGLSGFDIDSFRNIEWFQFLCERSGSPENYPDVFHLWTAERNGFDAVLTLERGLPNLVSRVRNEKVKTVKVKIEVLRPFDLLKKLGIKELDPVPMDTNRFYYLHELDE
jgi:hypothetical protein